MLDVVFGPIQDMTEGIIPIASKKAWSLLMWDRAWRVEDANWHDSNAIFKKNDLLTHTIGEIMYLTWWAISDLDYILVCMCEDMSNIICHASLSMRDDCRLKGLTMRKRTCTNCVLCRRHLSHYRPMPLLLVLQRKGYDV